ncbi:MAG: hypothetical protein ACE5F1_07165 [Planctomycetota bacterium]
MRARRSRLLKITKTLLCFLAGTLFGAGILLYGQVRLAEYMREQVESKFFLWRAIGDATYFLQGNDVQIALTLAKLPPASLIHSKRLGITLMVLAGLIMVMLPLVRRRGAR